MGRPSLSLLEPSKVSLRHPSIPIPFDAVPKLLHPKAPLATSPPSRSWQTAVSGSPNGRICAWSAGAQGATATTVLSPTKAKTANGEAELLLRQPEWCMLENAADDPKLGNPLQRHQRLGTQWMGVIMDYEGVVVEDAVGVHAEAWLRLAQEEGKPRPLTFALQRAARMKAEQAISEVLCWGRESTYVRRLSERKEQLFQELLGDWRPAVLPGVRDLLSSLQKQQVPVAICSTETSMVRDGLKYHGLEKYVSEVVAADDVYRCRPDPEAYAYAAQKIDRPPVRCIVFGICNQSVEAAHDCGMQCVAVAGQQPLYELTAADLVVKQVEDISFMNLKQLFRLEEGTEPQPELELEEETEVEPVAAPQGIWL